MIMNEERGSDSTLFLEALRLVAVVQASNAFVERVFSQLTYVRRVIGDQACEEVIMEQRTLLRCNRGLMDDFNDSV